MNRRKGIIAHLLCCLQSIMNTEDIRNSFSANFDERFEELLDRADGVMLTGSYAVGKSVSSSDIDIVVLSKRINYIYSESFYDAGQYFQLIFFPYYKVQFTLIDDTFKGKGIYRVIFKDGFILKDNSNEILTRMQKYMLSCRERKNEQEELTLVFKISNSLEALSAEISELEKIYIASEILLDISGLLTRRYVIDGKHNARHIISEKINRKFVESYRSLVSTQDVSMFIRDVDALLSKFGGRQNKYTSGWVYNFPYSDNLMVFFPAHVLCPKILERIHCIEKICHGCYSHVFYIGKNQSMEEGVYLSLLSPQKKISQLIEKLEEYRATIADDNIKQSVQMSFPYKTLFHEGVLLGGRNNLHRFVPYFDSIWHFFVEQVKHDFRQKSNVSKILSTLLLYELSKTVENTQYKEIINELYDKLVLEAVDPNGLYNMLQIDDIRAATLKLHSDTYECNISQYEEIIQAITKNQITEITQMRHYITNLFQIVHGINDDALIIPDIFNVSNKRTILYTNLLEHLMSIFQLTPPEKFGVVYNYSRYIQNHDF